MSTLVANANAVKSAAAAIDAAIVAKGGATAGGLRNAAAAIAALPREVGGEPWDYFNMSLEGAFELNGVEWLQNNLKGQAGLTSFASDARYLTNYMFQSCTALETVSLPNFVGVYNNDGHDRMFEQCTSLRSISLPSCISLHGFNFSGCTALEEVHLPVLTNFSHNGNFSQCPSVRRIEVPNLVPASNMATLFIYGAGSFSNCTVDISNTAASVFFDLGIQFGRFLATTSCIKTSDGYIRYVDGAWTHTEE